MGMSQDIDDYNAQQEGERRQICETLAKAISAGLPEAESKLWHGHPVWFLDGNPIVGYSSQKQGIRLMFWSGMGFDEPKLTPSTSGKFKDASIFYNFVGEIDSEDLSRWLEKSRAVQWDYKNIVKQKGKLERIR